MHIKHQISKAAVKFPTTQGVFDMQQIHHDGIGSTHYVTWPGLEGEGNWSVLARTTVTINQQDVSRLQDDLHTCT